MADDLKAALLAAAVPHVAFDGWSDASFAAAAADAGIAPALARGVCPRGALDLALAYHASGDAAMRAALAGADLAGMRYRERIAHAVRLRLDGADRELVRRGVALFALPQHVVEGSRAIWGTADAIWTALGDTSDDISHYSKRAILSAVYSATALDGASPALILHMVSPDGDQGFPGRLTISVRVTEAGQEVVNEIARDNGLSPEHLQAWRQWVLQRQ